MELQQTRKLEPGPPIGSQVTGIGKFIRRTSMDEL